MLQETIKICQNPEEKNSHNKFMKMYNNNVYNANPDSFRDYIYFATLNLMKGDW